MTWIQLALWVFAALVTIVAGTTFGIYLRASASPSDYLVRLYLWSDFSYRILGRGYFDLCNFFWVTLTKATLSTATVIGAGLLIALWIVEWIVNPWGALLPLAILGVAITIVAVGGAVVAGSEAIAASTAWQFIKGNYCPRIRLED